MTTIVHYGAGNIRSVMRALERLDEPGVITSDPDVVRKATRLILPGVGSFDAAVRHLRSHHLHQSLEEKVLKDKTPILGICLGLQLFTERSEEGTEPGLGWIPGETRRFRPATPEIKVPHIGWNEVEYAGNSPLWNGLPSLPSFYFVHSYYVTCRLESSVTGRSRYGEEFVSAVQVDNIFGVQFHPEKSQQVGLTLLSNFMKST